MFLLATASQCCWLDQILLEKFIMTYLILSILFLLVSAKFVLRCYRIPLRLFNQSFLPGLKKKYTSVMFPFGLFFYFVFNSANDSSLPIIIHQSHFLSSLYPCLIPYDRAKGNMFAHYLFFSD